MKKFLFLTVLFLLVSGPVFSAARQKLLVLPFAVIETNLLSGNSHFATNAFTWLLEDLPLQNYFDILSAHPNPSKFSGKGAERDAMAGKTEGADLVLSGYLDWFDNKFIVNVRMTSVTNKKKIFEDQVYTFDLTNTAGLRNSVSNLALRIVRKMKGEEVEAYSEGVPGEEMDETTNENGTNLAPAEKARILRQLSLLSLGYQFPTGFEFTFIEASYNWLHPDWRCGIGLGSYLVKMCPNFPGYTNATGTILPVQLSVPVWTNPDKDKITDILFRAEWAWYAPFNISGSSTNTNAPFFLDTPVNYLDLRFSFYFTSFADLNAGCAWLYNTGNVYFYIGGTVFLGFYQKE